MSNRVSAATANAMKRKQWQGRQENKRNREETDEAERVSLSPGAA
jgi:hypothetical protein